MSKKVSEKDKVEAIAMYLTMNITMQEIANQFGVAKSSVCKWIKSYEEEKTECEKNDSEREPLLAKNTETERENKRDVIAVNTERDGENAIEGVVSNAVEERNTAKPTLCVRVKEAVDEITSNAMEGNKRAREILLERLEKMQDRDLLAYYEKTSNMLRIDVGKATESVKVLTFDSLEEYD